ncbi:MAG: cupin domain-containing protein [Verrucomicrobiales bacterium]|nr:cupin domain-containing protein [Verrucomicrobiales bacterium]
MSKATSEREGEPRRYAVVALEDVPAVDCPCGQARRGFTDFPGAPASVHVVDISRDSRAHYHKRMTETYVVLEGEGTIELDGEVLELKPLMSVMIRPGCVHRARPVEGGVLRILNVAVPVFDAADEWEV